MQNEKWEKVHQPFMAAHGTTLEVLGEAGKIKYKQRFCTKVSTDVKCIFCSMQFPTAELCKKHIVNCHWTIFEHTVSICYTCLEFLYENVISTVYVFPTICEFLYMNVYIYVVHVILSIFLHCRGRNREERENMVMYMERVMTRK